MAKVIITDQSALERNGGIVYDSSIPDSVFNAETETYDLVEVPIRKLALPNGFMFDIWDDHQLSVLFSPGYESVEFRYLRSWLVAGNILHRFEA